MTATYISGNFSHIEFDSFVVDVDLPHSGMIGGNRFLEITTDLIHWVTPLVARKSNAVTLPLPALADWAVAKYCLLGLPHCGIPKWTHDLVMFQQPAFCLDDQLLLPRALKAAQRALLLAEKKSITDQAPRELPQDVLKACREIDAKLAWLRANRDLDLRGKRILVSDEGLHITDKWQLGKWWCQSEFPSGYTVDDLVEDITVHRLSLIQTLTGDNSRLPAEFRDFSFWTALAGREEGAAA